MERRMLSKILTPAQDELLKEERRILARLRVALSRFDAAVEHQEALDRSIEQLDELFLLVVIGEFNAGKSAFINALLGSRVVAEGVTPTTAQINVLQYGDAIERLVREPNLHVITAPAPLLREIHIVDTPGTNAIIREHEAITAQFVPRSDLVLFVTSADRPFTETERAFLEQVRGWGKKVVVVINKVDILDSPHDVEAVRDVRGGERARAARVQPGNLHGQLAARAARKRGRRRGLEPQRLRCARALHRDHARRPRPRAAEAPEPARRRSVARRAALRVRQGTARPAERGFRDARGSRAAVDRLSAGSGPRLRAADVRHRPDPAADGASRARLLRRDHADRAGDGSAQPQPGAAGVRAAGRRRRPAANRTEGRRAGRLARGRRPASVAGGDAASRRTPPAVPEIASSAKKAARGFTTTGRA